MRNATVRTLAALVVAPLAAAACGSPAEPGQAAGTTTSAPGGAASTTAPGPRRTAHADLRAPDGTSFGTVEFAADGPVVRVTYRASSLPAGVARNAFHGFHVHANNDPANGVGCVADPTKPSNTWFTSADGHWVGKGDAAHGAHGGDLSPLFVTAAGTAHLSMETDRLDPAALADLAVILHARPDNLGNVPTGVGPNEYTANGPGATDSTTKTGNAGDRIACGVVQLG